MENLKQPNESYLYASELYWKDSARENAHVFPQMRLLHFYTCKVDDVQCSSL